MAQIFGVNGYSRLMLGREFNINQVKTKTFKVAPTSFSTYGSTASGIVPGDLLIRTDATQVYTTPDTVDSANDFTAARIAGVCLATNVKLDKTFPNNGEAAVPFMPGESGACVVQGEVAVKLTGAAPAEGAAVYYDLANAAFTATARSNVALANMQFSGITEGNLTVVNIRY